MGTLPKSVTISTC